MYCYFTLCHSCAGRNRGVLNKIYDICHFCDIMGIESKGLGLGCRKLYRCGTQNMCRYIPDACREADCYTTGETRKQQNLSTIDFRTSRPPIPWRFFGLRKKEKVMVRLVTRRSSTRRIVSRRSGATKTISVRGSSYLRRK